MKEYKRLSVFKRDILGVEGGRQFKLPWGPGRTISTIQAAERLGVCHDTVRTMCEEGEIQGWQIRKKKGSPWRVSADSVELYIDRKIAEHDIGDPELHRRLGLPNTQNAPKR